MVNCSGCGSANVVYLDVIIFSKPSFSGEFLMKTKERMVEVYKCNDCENTFMIEEQDQ